MKSKVNFQLLYIHFRLPPSNLIHPQVGRSMTRHQAIKPIGAMKPVGQRKPSPTKRKKQIIPPNPVEEVFKCSKCPDSNESTFKNREEFFVHVLECGGEVDWDVTKKKSKKKKKVSNSRPRTNSTEVNIGKLILLFE